MDEFEAELTRLTALNIPDDELEIARRYYSQKERKTMNAGSFCGPHRSFPITNQADVNNAARLIGHADNPDAVKACIKRKAKANGWSIPDSWKDGDSGDRNMNTDLERAKAAANHPAMTGRHSHGHPHEIDGYGHEHSHEHANDNEHDHTHTHHRAVETELEAQMYIPITRIDKDTWEVEGQATSDAVDYYNTIFDYESSKRAFQAWRGNIREMHQDKAVGRAIEVKPDDETRTIAVRAFVSKGARDTWEKVLDGTLSGFSIGVPRGRFKEKMVERGGKSVKMYYDHELAELSLVDNPGSPGCNIAVVRADGVATDVLDDSEETLTPEDANHLLGLDVKRAGATISHATQSQLHGVRDGLLRQLDTIVDLCMCDECAALCSLFDPDDDGDFDIVPSLDYDNDGGSGGQDMMGSGVPAYALEAAITRHMEGAITRHMSPMITRMHAMLSQQAQRSYPQPQELSTEPLERRIEAMETRIKSDNAEVRSLLSEVKGLAEKIAAQPMPGGPVMTPVDKRLATSPAQGFNPNDDIAAIQRAAQLGLLKDQESQTAAAAQLIRLQNPGR